MASPTSPLVPPLVLTIRFDLEASQYFTALRDQHFPSALNVIPAHATLFHQLPGMFFQQMLETLRANCVGVCPLPVNVTGLRFLGRGVAYRLESSPLSSLRRQLAHLWDAHLTPQDRQPFQPHITIQNKVPPAEAQLLYRTLTAAFRPWTFTCTGLDLWHYLGGPWEHAAFIRFPPPTAELEHRV